MDRKTQDDDKIKKEQKTVRTKNTDSVNRKSAANKDTRRKKTNTDDIKDNKKSNEKKQKLTGKAIAIKSAVIALKCLLGGVLVFACSILGLLLGVVVGCILTTDPVAYTKDYEDTDYVTHIYAATGIFSDGESFLNDSESSEDEEKDDKEYIVLDDGTVLKSIGTLKGATSITNGEWVDIEYIPQNLQHAFVAIEDERFYEHDGVDLKRTLSAIAGYFIPGMSDHGGSTITQQVVKNLTGDDERSIPRKVREQWRALQLERDLQKKDIMELYLNIIYFANGAYGVQDAAQTYFGKDVSALSLAECAFLAGITNSPGKYNPATMPGRTNAYERQITILDAMYAQGWITKNQYIEAIQTELVFVSKDSGNDNSSEDSSDESESTESTTVSTSSVYSYFMDMVISDVRDDLMEMGYSKKEANNIIYNSGVQIITTQDLSIQELVDAEYKNIENFPVNTSDSNDPDNAQSAVVIMDQSNGHVIAVCGGYGEKQGSLSWNRATDIQRQPGSSIKPVLVYAPLIDQGVITAATAMDEIPVYLDKINPDKLWPTNSDHKYHGLVNVRIAVSRSHNVFAVNLYKNNVTSCLAYMKSVGIDRTDETHLSMALGGFTNGVSPMEMAAAYVPMANGGTYYKPITYTKLIDKDGNVLIDKTAEAGSKVYTKDTTSTVMTELLKSVIEGAVERNGTGRDISIKDKNGNKMPAAGKTGTTTDVKDYWFVGYTPYYTCAVWYGYDNQTAISSAESGSARKIWNVVMNRIHEKLETKAFEVYGNVETATICSVSGKRPTDACYASNSRLVYTETFEKGTVPSGYCDMHVSKKICTVGTDKYGRYYLAGANCKSVTTVSKIYRKSIPDYLWNIDKSKYPEDWSSEFSHSYCPHCK